MQRVALGGDHLGLRDGGEDAVESLEGFGAARAEPVSVDRRRHAEVFVTELPGEPVDVAGAVREVD